MTRKELLCTMAATIYAARPDATFASLCADVLGIESAIEQAAGLVRATPRTGDECPGCDGSGLWDDVETCNRCGGSGKLAERSE